MSAQPPERQRGPARFLLIASASLYLLILGGCDGDQAVEQATDVELLARASAAIHDRPHQIIGRPGERGPADAVAYVDLVALREQLGLPPDAGLRPATGKRRLLFGFATRPLFRYGTLVRRRASLRPFAEVLDGGQIETAAGTNPAIATPGADLVYRGDVIVVRTGQPFGQIASLLERQAGYEETQDGLLLGGEQIGPRGPGVPGAGNRIAFPAVGDAGGGVVVFGGSARAVRAALGGADAELTPAAELVAELSGVSRVAQGGPGHSCVLAIGLGEGASPREAELRVLVDGEATAGRLHAGGWPGWRASARGDQASARLSSPDELEPTALAAENVEFAYKCP